ncbi:hypothetical protein FHS79_003339 [Polymorphobacter multimanifer]|uniref:Uncharacterized protein n=1 Tax=Polymorphobacter multimanifer TaxID=1070431 RepID=A0A841LJJ7_9SPHN|nr:hypothetical protein [Polymorphobacter multimanifer]MBB6229138.1 hypothetical protein [Polymorphobacter multimanifer]
MDNALPQDRVQLLRAYAAGQLGTRSAIERLGMRDYADLVIALAQDDLGLPKPAETSAHMAHVARARAILQPRLRHGG